MQQAKWFCEKHLKSYCDNFNLALPESAVLCHLNELARGVGPLNQHVTERPFGHERVEPVSTTLLHVSVDFINGNVSAQVFDQCFTAWTQDPMHFVQGLNRLSKILECRRTIDEIERLVCKRHR